MLYNRPLTTRLFFPGEGGPPVASPPQLHLLIKWRAGCSSAVVQQSRQLQGHALRSLDPQPASGKSKHRAQLASHELAEILGRQPQYRIRLGRLVRRADRRLRPGGIEQHALADIGQVEAHAVAE